MKVLGVTRATRFSPNMVDNDRAILEMSLQQMAAAGADVVGMMNEEELSPLMPPPAVDMVLHMTRSADALSCLEYWNRQGIVVVNHPQSIRNVSRRQWAALAKEHALPIPHTELLPTDGYCYHGFFPCWIKMADACAQREHDVLRVTDAEALQDGMQQFCEQHVDTMVVSEHLDGDEVKFYGVAGTDFFYWFYPAEHGYGKFAWERERALPVHHAFSDSTLQTLCERMAEVTGLMVYGGDAIVSAEGGIRVIDFNDWPSFSPIREAAAKAIAVRAMGLWH